MTNFPSLSEAAEDLLIKLLTEADRGGGTLARKSPERDQLRRKGLIYSRPPNAGGGPAISGHGYRWRPTPFGREVAEAIRRERFFEGKAFYGDKHFWIGPRR